MPCGCKKVRKGEPGTRTSAPVAETVYADTVLELKFAAYKNCPEGSIAIAVGSNPAAVEDTKVNAPEAGVMEYVAT